MFVLSGRSVNKDDMWYSIVWYKALCAFSGTVSSPPIRQSDLTIHDPDTEFYLLPYYEKFSWSICERCYMSVGNAYSSGHLAPSLVGLAYALIVQTCLVVIFLTFDLEYLSGFFFLFLLKCQRTKILIWLQRCKLAGAVYSTLVNVW